MLSKEELLEQLPVISCIIKLSQGCKGQVDFPVLRMALSRLGWSIQDASIPKKSSLDTSFFKGAKKSYCYSPSEGTYFYFDSEDDFDASIKDMVERGGSEISLTPDKKIREMVNARPVGDVIINKNPTWISVEDSRGKFRSKIMAWKFIPGCCVSNPSGEKSFVAFPASKVNSVSDVLEPWQTFSWASIYTAIYKLGMKASALEYIESEADDELIEFAKAGKKKREEILAMRETIPEIEALFEKLCEHRFQEFVALYTDRLITESEDVSSYFEDSEYLKRVHRETLIWEDRRTTFTYETMKEKNGCYVNRDLLRSITRTVKVKGKGSSLIRTDVMREDTDQICRDLAKKYAEQVRDSFVIKNSIKMSHIVKSKNLGTPKSEILSMEKLQANFNGRVLFSWDDGSRFELQNNTVHKVSNLGTPFCQYPTTYHNVILPGGKPMKDVCELNMVKVFAKAT